MKIRYATLTVILMSSCQAPGGHGHSHDTQTPRHSHLAYGSQEGLVKQAELYGQIYKEEGDAYVGSDLETYYACQRLLYTMDRYATEEYGARWQAARDRETKRVDAFHAAHPE
jgi:hypothetical protein